MFTSASGFGCQVQWNIYSTQKQLDLYFVISITIKSSLLVLHALNTEELMCVVTHRPRPVTSRQSKKATKETIQAGRQAGKKPKRAGPVHVKHSNTMIWQEAVEMGRHIYRQLIKEIGSRCAGGCGTRWNKVKITACWMGNDSI